MEEAVLPGEVVAERQLDRDLARLDPDQPRTEQVHDALTAEAGAGAAAMSVSAGWKASIGIFGPE